MAGYLDDFNQSVSGDQAPQQVPAQQATAAPSYLDSFNASVVSAPEQKKPEVSTPGYIWNRIKEGFLGNVDAQGNAAYLEMGMPEEANVRNPARDNMTPYEPAGPIGRAAGIAAGNLAGAGPLAVMAPEVTILSSLMGGAGGSAAREALGLFGKPTPGGAQTAEDVGNFVGGLLSPRSLNAGSLASRLVPKEAPALPTGSRLGEIFPGSPRPGQFPGGPGSPSGLLGIEGEPGINIKVPPTEPSRINKIINGLAKKSIAAGVGAGAGHVFGAAQEGLLGGLLFEPMIDHYLPSITSPRLPKPTNWSASTWQNLLAQGNKPYGQ